MPNVRKNRVRPKNRKRSELELTFEFQLNALKLLPHEYEFIFHETKRYRFDFAWPDIKFAVEIQGGEFINGAHNRGLRMRQDFEKLGEALMLGWNVYYCTGAMVKDGSAVNFVEKYFKILNDHR